MSKNEKIKKAEEEFDYLTGDAATRRIAELREKAIRDERAALKKAQREGHEAGVKEGHEVRFERKAELLWQRKC